MSFPYMKTSLTKRLVFNKKGGNVSQGRMSFPYMNTNLTRRLVFNKQVDKRHFSQGLMSSPYMNTNLTKRLVFNKQADKRESKGRQGVRKGEMFHRVLCPFLI